MKKSTKAILAPATAVLALAACSKLSQKDAASCPDNEIRFGNGGIAVETKAFAETTDKTLQKDGFKAAAVFDNGGGAMFNKAVSYSNGQYSVPGEHYYFPLEGTMSFYGVYPPSQEITLAGGEATLSYRHNADNDLIGAKVSGVKGRGSAVVMNFDHLLSQVSVNVKGAETTVDYKLLKVKITDADGGTYSFAEGTWTPDGTTADYTVYSDASGMAVSTSDMTAVGPAMSFIPGDIRINAVWKCYNKGTSTLLCEKDVTVDAALLQGSHTSLNLTLPFDSSDLKFDVSLGAWSKKNQDIEMDYPAAVNGTFTVSPSGKKVKFAKGNLYWNGTEFLCEEHQYDYPKVWDTNHVGHFFWSSDPARACSPDYADPTRSVDDEFFAAEGRIFNGWTVLSEAEWIYLLENSLCTDICQNVKLYNDDMDYCCFHFAGTYEQAKAAFESNERAQECYEGRSFDELYAAETITAWDTIARNIAGVGCAIFRPDGFSGTLQESYSAAEWALAEKDYGLVALPYAGYRDSTDICSAGYANSCWSGTPWSNKDYALDVYFEYDYAGDNNVSRSQACSIRQVRVQ